jgi:tetratricopeptide (TPR) repeat protein
VWDVETGKSIATLAGHAERVESASFSPDGRRVVTASDDKTARVWDLGSIRNDVDWIGLAEVFGGERLDSAGALAPMPADELRRRFASLLERYREFFIASPSQMLAWHLRQLAGDEQDGAWDRAIAHLDALIAAEPDEGDHLRRKGKALHKLGRLEEAMAAHDRAVSLRPADWRVWVARADAHADMSHWAEAERDDTKALELGGVANGVPGRRARLALAMNSMAGYQKACSELLSGEISTDDAGKLDRILWVCCLSARGRDDHDQMAKLLAALVTNDTKNPLYLQTAGAVNYRAGKFEAAVTRLNEVIKLKNEKAQKTSSPSNGDPFDWLFLAMAHHRVGHKDEAKSFFEKAKTWITKSTRDKPADETLGKRVSWETWLELQILSREADELINGKKDAKPAAEKR